MKSVYVILVNYNGINDTIECIDSINRFSPDVKIVVVDNNSELENVEALRTIDSIYKLICLEDNIGFSGANNIGIQFSIEDGADYIALLNNDTVLLNDVFRILKNEMGYDEIVSPIIYDLNHDIWYSGGHIDYLKGYAIHYNEINEKKNDYLTGCCFLTSVATINKIGMLDEKCFMYCEDFDYSCRANELGIRIRCIPSASITHKVGRSTGGEKSKFTTYYTSRNRIYVIRKNRFPMVAFLYTLITRYLKYLKAKFITNDNDIVIKRAIYDGLHKKMGKTY